MLASLAAPLAAQNVVDATSGDPHLIAAIRSRFGMVERKLPTFDIVDHDIHGFSAEGGTLRAYFDGSQLKKLTARFFGESGRATEEYYFDGGEPVFVYRVDERYDPPLSGRVVRRILTRYYLSGGQLVRRVHMPTRSGDVILAGEWKSADELRRDAILLARCARAVTPDAKACTVVGP